MSLELICINSNIRISIGLSPIKLFLLALSLIFVTINTTADNCNFFCQLNQTP